MTCEHCEKPEETFCSLCDEPLMVTRVSDDNSDLSVAAMKLFEPPFTFVHGYIYDNANHVVSDDGDIGEMEKAVISRVRGWGRLQYLKDKGFTPAQLQDAVGGIIVTALNEYWANRSGIDRNYGG